MQFEPTPLAKIDRWVTERAGNQENAPKARVSELANVPRWVLLGEPGSGKSAVLKQIAAEAGVSVVTARALVEGERPTGPVVFIDAFEEYRMGESARERLSDLATALKTAHYIGWRIACRSISLPPSEVRFLTISLGAFSLWQLQPLDGREVQAILKTLKETDPVAFARRIEAMAAGSLMGNPATLVLLQRTMASKTVCIVTRNDLFIAATWQMAHELNVDLPDNPSRPGPGSILKAAETSCLILLLSGRSEIWTLNKLPEPHVVTFDDLIPAGVSTHALMFALDTPMFRGEAGAFMPTHRIVAEYLGGRALARATDLDPLNNSQSVLPISRALAFLCGDGSRPAPALTGLYAWFVSALAHTRHHRRALELVEVDPESILFHGDPAALPTEHRRALLHAVGRGDPWFLSNSQGSTALAGLAGDDLADDLATIICNANDTFQRRAMAIGALATGRPVRALSSNLESFVANPSTPEGLRVLAIDACTHIAEDPNRVRRALLTAISVEPNGGSVMLRLKLLAPLIGISAEVAELRRVITDYAATADGVMGYARQIGDALVAAPVPILFDEPLPGLQGVGARRIEVVHMLDAAMAAAIEATQDLPAERLLHWLRNLHQAPIPQLSEGMRKALLSWLGRSSTSEISLFDAILLSTIPSRRIGVGGEFHRIVGRPLSANVRRIVVERLESMSSLPITEGLKSAATIASILTFSDPRYSDLFERTMAVVTARTDELRETLSWLLTPADDSWRDEDVASQQHVRSERDRRQVTDRAWLAANRTLVQSASHLPSLINGARIVLGEYYHEVAQEDGDLLSTWYGSEGATDIRAGWMMLADDFPISAKEQGQAAARATIKGGNWVAAAHAAEQVLVGPLPPMSLPYAFGILCGSFLVKVSESRDAIRKAAVDRILADAGGQAALAEFWTEAIRAGAQDLPNLADFSGRGPQLGFVLEFLLRCQFSLGEALLQSMIMAAIRNMLPATIMALAEAALAQICSSYAKPLWTFAAFLADPLRHGLAFKREISAIPNHKAFGELYAVASQFNLNSSSEVAIKRDTLVVRHLGALYTPSSTFADSADLGRIVGQAVENIAQLPLEAAGRALRSLSEDKTLAAWREMLQHNQARQEKTQREAAFTAPLPRDVAIALRSGPPAVPSDLRAVVHELLIELGEEIRSGPTSPWRGFWNRPQRGKKTPKVENDCRDLIADRLSDRLIPFRIRVRSPVSTEARSGNDRRVDMVVLGEGAAALPIEVKRHWNRELWTAPMRQLEPYARSLNSAGNGVYLVLWFGPYAAVPGIPKGVGPILSANALRAALVDHLPSDKTRKFDIVVLDVSDQDTIKTTKPKQTVATRGRRLTKTLRTTKSKSQGH